ncbi:MAG: hypothetical protein NVSMB2_03870 [Chloroflexota bacterium]
MADGLLDRARTAVKRDDLMTTAGESVNHIAAHPTEANETKLHVLHVLSSDACCVRTLASKVYGSFAADQA